MVDDSICHIRFSISLLLQLCLYFATFPRYYHLFPTPLLRVICPPYAGIAYLYTKFDDCSFSRSRYMVGAHQDLNGVSDLTTPLSGMVFHLRSSTCYDQPIYQI